MKEDSGLRPEGVSGVRKFRPLPWRVYEDKSCFNGWAVLVDAKGDMVDASGDGGFDDETAAHILKAVNLHDELVAALERITTTKLTSDEAHDAAVVFHRLNACVKMAKEALEKAK